MSGWNYVSAAIGWMYFAAWSVSFYPQLVLLVRRKSATGLSFDFLIYNVLGFTCYAAFTLTFFVNHAIRDEYATINNGQAPLMEVNDVVFALHALLLTIATLVVALYYALID